MAARTPALEMLTRLGIGYELHEYPHTSGTTSFGDEAADALGVEPDRVFKTLVVTDDVSLFVAMVPVTRSLDLKAMAATCGVKRLELAPVPVAQRATGYVIGAISPLGQKRELPTVIDESAHDWTTIFCSGGRRGLELELALVDLLALTKGQTGAIAR